MKKFGLNFVAVVVVALVAAGTSLAAAPMNSVLPTVSGYAHVGYVLSAAKGTWAGSPVTFTYQWQACTDREDVGTCADIGSATRSTYTPVVGNAGKGIRVKVTAVNTLNRPGKTRRTRNGLGKRKDTKRAIVTLAAGSKPIDLFGAPA